MNAKILYQEGKLEEAIASLNVDLRNDPTDVQRRTFLFELLCFAGDYDRAGKQLEVLGSRDPEAAMGVLSYQTVVECEKGRQEMFVTGAFPESETEPRPVRGRLNGEAFDTLEDADPRIGARLEVFLGSQYNWMPLEHLTRVEMGAPAKLRDILWATATIEAGEELGGADWGDVLIPALTPSASAHPDELVRLGRVTDWVELEGGLVTPVGQKMLLVDDEEFPILEVRELEIDGPSQPTD